MKKSYFLKIILRSAVVVLIASASISAALAQAEDFPNFKTTPTGKGIMLMNQKGSPDYAVLIEGGTEARRDAADDSVRIKITGGSEVAAYYADAKLYAKTKTDAPETLMKNYRASQLAQLETEKNKKSRSTKISAANCPFSICAREKTPRFRFTLRSGAFRFPAHDPNGGCIWRSLSAIRF